MGSTRRLFGLLMFLMVVMLIAALPEYLQSVALLPMVGAMLIGLWLVVK